MQPTHRRHDAFGGLEPPPDRAPEQAIPGMQFPLSVVGPYSPSELALRMLVKSSLAFGAYLLALRLLLLVSPGLARFGVNIFSALFAIALIAHSFSRGRGMPEWPAWVGVILLVLIGADGLLPGLDLFRELPGQDSLPALIQPLLLVAAIVFALAHFFLPAVRRVTSGLAGGTLVIALVGAFLGGRAATTSYFPESDFSAWTYFSLTVLMSLAACVVIADQYARFQEAVNPSAEPTPDPGLASFKACYPTLYGLFLGGVWVGNIFFNVCLGWSIANLVGLLGFLAMVALWSQLPKMDHPLRPYRTGWAALTFFLTYNLQQVSNPNVFQLRPFLREPLVRLAIVCSASGLLSLGLLHLSGVQAPPGSNPARPTSRLPVWNYLLPQNYARFTKAPEADDDSAHAIIHRYSQKLEAEGDTPGPTATPVRSLGGLAVRALLVLAGGPLLFFFIFATTQGYYLARKEGMPADSSSSAGCPPDSGSNRPD